MNKKTDRQKVRWMDRNRKYEQVRIGLYAFDSWLSIQLIKKTASLVRTALNM